MYVPISKQKSTGSASHYVPDQRLAATGAHTRWNNALQKANILINIYIKQDNVNKCE